MNLAKPLVARGKDGVLQVIKPGRISKQSQDMDSITANHEDAEQWLNRVYPGLKNVHRLGEQASGWLADRDTMVAAKALIKSGAVDLVLATELREIYRNPKFQWDVVQTCLDNGVRFILLTDNVDTDDENWEVMFHVASLRAGLEVPAARQRVRRKAKSSFSRGGMVMKVKYGYRKLTKEEAATGQYGPVGLRVAKVPECTPLIQEMRRRVIRGDSYVVVGEWLTEDAVVTGLYATDNRWTGKLVADLLRDPILSGRKRFRTTIHKLIYESGKHRAEPNPLGPDTKEYAELAHFTPEEHTSLLAVMDARKQVSQKGQRLGRENPLWNQDRRRSVWPGQHATCGVCRGRMYRCGTFLRCQNSLPDSPEHCWNHVQVDFACVRAKVLPWVLGVLDRHPGFRARLVDAAWAEFERRSRRNRQAGNSLDQTIKDLTAQGQRLAKAIAKGGEMDALLVELRLNHTAVAQARKDRDKREDDAGAAGAFTSRDDVATRLDAALTTLVLTSVDMADLLRRLLPTFVIQPVQALDCPQIRPRAKLVLRPDGWATGAEPVEEVSVTLDLFEPPVHIQHLAACVAARQANPKSTLRTIARSLGINYMTVKRALAYYQLMQRAGARDPYREIHEPPTKASRWKKRGRRNAA
jgi:site-specific DNA recombinase